MTTPETPESQDLQAAAPQFPVERLPSRPDADAPVDILVLDLSRRLTELRERGQQHSQADHGALANQVDICSSLLALIDTQSIALRQRLSKAESQIHEQSLQLQARVTESQTDALTGIANRRAFDQHFHERCAAAHDSHCPMSLIMIDVDHFKKANDAHGHHVGDALLRGLANILRDRLPSGALLARYGGEEFTIAVYGMYLDQVIQLVEELRINVCHTRFRHEGIYLSVTISCGVAQLNPRDNPGQVVQRADVALYAAKQGGRNCTYWHDGQYLHLAAVNGEAGWTEAKFDVTDLPGPVVELSTLQERSETNPFHAGWQSASALIPRSTRANWCDGAMLFWYIRQRIEELKHGGDPFCVLAFDVDNAQHVSRRYGGAALHFMMRAQMLHIDATLRNMDIVARTCHARIIAVLPRVTLDLVQPVLVRLRKTMDPFP